jgi:TRAP-type C4-dicarboxylate transport system permease small subunit
VGSGGRCWFDRINRVVELIAKGIEFVGLAAFACIVLVTLVDVLGDQFFNRPLAGNTELIGLLQVIAISSGLAYSFIDGRQIYVGVLRDSLKGWKRVGIETLCGALGFGFWGIACWTSLEQGAVLFRRGTGTFLLGVPNYPFVFWVGIMCAIPMCLVIAIEVAKAWRKKMGGGDFD